MGVKFLEPYEFSSIFPIEANISNADFPVLKRTYEQLLLSNHWNQRNKRMNLANKSYKINATIRRVDLFTRPVIKQHQ